MTFHDLGEIPYLRVTPLLVEMLDLTTYEEESEGGYKDDQWDHGKQSKELMSW